MSLYDLSLYVADYLHRWEYPCEVKYNNDRITPENRERYTDRVVFAFDRSQGDSFAPVTNPQQHGRRQAMLARGALVTIRAASPEEGARTSDHELAVELYRDAVIFALAAWANSARHHQLAMSGGRFLASDERADVEAWAGAVYELRFALPHPVEQRKYPGDWRDTYTLQAGDFAPTIITPKLAQAAEE